MKNLSATLLALLLCINLTSAQDYYWVGGTGDWSDFTNHWATTSGGSTFHTSAPTSTDNVFFDANSFSSSGLTVTLDVEADCNSMDWSGVTNFPSFQGDGNDLNIYGSLIFSPDMTINLNDIEFESGGTGNTITTSGEPLGTSSILRFRGTGEWTLQDELNCDDIYVHAGTFNTNNNNINAEDRFRISDIDANAKTVNLGSSVITTERWEMSSDQVTFNAGTSKIVVSTFNGDQENGGPFTYHDVEFYNFGRWNNSATFDNVTVPAGLELLLKAGDTFTVNSFTADGTKHNPIILGSQTEGSEGTISKTSGTVDIEYVEMQDVHATGGATFNATNSIDNGNNTGWNISAATGQNYYWVGNSGDWTDVSHWATTSGGATLHTDYPGKLDNVFIDGNSFTMTGQTLEVDTDVEFHDLNFTGVTNEPTFDAPLGNGLEAFGSVTFTTGVDKDISNLNLASDEMGETITYADAGPGKVSFITVVGDGHYTFMDDFSISTFNQLSGTVTLNDINVDCSLDFKIGNPGTKVTNMGSSTVTCRDFDINTTELTFNKGTSTIITERNFDGEGLSYYKLVLGSTHVVTGGNTFDILEAMPGANISFEAGETQTVAQTLSLVGNKANPINISSNSGGVQATLFKASGTVDATYLVIVDNAATGGATFNATQTVDNGNVTGWNITGIVGTDYYWVGDGGNWSDFANHWATSSGGSTFYTEVPGVLDNVFFDANSFSSGGQTVTLDSDVNFNDMDWTSVTNSPTWAGSTHAANVYGSLMLDPTVNVQVNDFNFYSTNSETISAGTDQPGTNANFDFLAAGEWTLQTDLKVRELTINSGTLNTNDQSVHIDFKLEFLGADTKELTLGSSDVFARSWEANFSDNVTVDGGNSSITTSSTFRPLGASGNNVTLNDLTFILFNPTDEGKLHGDITLNTLTFTAGTTIGINSINTITVTQLVAAGTSDDVITIAGITDDIQATISQAAGTVAGDYLVLKDIAATGGATFNANNSVNNGNVSGWIFNKLSQTIDFPAIPAKTFGDAPFTLTATASSGLAVEFSVISGPATFDSGTGLLTLTGGGTVQVKAEQAGDIDYDPAPSVINSFDVGKADQTITFDDIPSKTFGEADFDLVATGGGSGNAVTFMSSDLSVATISGSTVTIVGAGSATITANQSGNDDYNDAAPVEKNLTVAKAIQTITFDDVGNITIDDSPVTLVATATSGLTVSFSVQSGPATVSGDQLTVTGDGQVIVVASQSGDGNYEAATDVSQTITVGVVSLEDGFYSAIKLYPNPFSSTISIRFPEQMQEQVQIEISDLAGKAVSRFKLDAKQKEMQFGNELRPGIWLIRVTGSRTILYKVLKR